MRVLHVTECFAGGVSKAILTRVECAGNDEHHLLWTGDEFPPSAEEFLSTLELPRGFFARLWTTRKHIREVQPDIIHAHSSWAGLYTRLVQIRTPVVYEPHCFKFDDPNLHPLAKTLFRFAEKLLARNTAVFGVLTPHESALAEGLSKHAKIVLVPNVSFLTPNQDLPSDVHIRKVVMSGRIVPQKDPDFFLRTVSKVREQLPDLEFVWVGDGDLPSKAHLTYSDVRVTGWLDSAQLEKELSNSIYFHSARYEGFPLSVLDAAIRNAPIVARVIPAFKETPLIQSNDENTIARHIVQLTSPGPLRESAFENNRLINTRHSKIALARAVKRLYEKALENA